jgi:hypothetical protein
MTVDSLLETYGNLTCKIDFKNEPLIKINTSGQRFAQLVGHIYDYISFELYDDKDKLAKLIENIEELSEFFSETTIIATLISVEAGIVDVLASDYDYNAHAQNLELWRFNLICEEKEQQ